jgi:tetratricopeptide (TPR) repeat protein
MSVLKKPALWAVLVLLGLVAGYWWLRTKPVARALYQTAEDEYHDGHYRASLDLLKKASEFELLSPSIMRLTAWNHLQLRELPEAEKLFRRSLIFNPWSSDSRLGLGFTYLEMRKPEEALNSFSHLSAAEQRTSQVRTATSGAYLLQGENSKALSLIESVLASEPGNSVATQQLAMLTGVTNLADLTKIPPPGAKPKQPQIPARLNGGRFEVPIIGQEAPPTAAPTSQQAGAHVLPGEGNAWKEFYISGVNIGPAMPGHFATEPPFEEKVYFDWLTQIAAMGANCVRVYTLLPPGFYRALYLYDAHHPDYPLYLFQEIWLKDPPDDNLTAGTFTEDFNSSVRNVVDALHGRASLPVSEANRAGEAGGIYAADVSNYVLGWLVGREIEPHVAITTNLRNPRMKHYKGTYLSIRGGNATEVWLTEQCDELVRYEMEKYNSQHPVAFVNWPPLDPLHHPTEARLVDELRIRTKLGEKLKPLGIGVQDDADVVSIDEEKVNAEPAFKAGYFALFHAYPFWPDFVFLDPAYREATDSQGLDSYWGYLQALKAHYQHTPMVIGEYGLSTSIGIAHFNPMGLTHGGLNEVEQGQGLVRLTENIQQSGFAGGIVFEWIDEWWKHNWIALDFEKPFERKALWHNEMDPEQFFGLMKFVPVNSAIPTTLTGNTLAPGRSTPVSKEPPGESPAAGPPRVRWISANSDPSALYIDFAIDLPPTTEIDWSKGGYEIALNTCGVPCGSGSLPGLPDIHMTQGANFVVRLSSEGAGELLIAHDYNPYHEVPVEGVPNLTDIILPRNWPVGFQPDGKFEDLIVEANRRRYTPDGTLIPAKRYSRSILRFGDFDSAASDYDSLGEWYYDQANSRVRLRLPWGLLLVLDPSEGFIFNGTNDAAEPVGRISKTIQVTAVGFSAHAGSGKEFATQVDAKRVSNGEITEGWSMPWPTWSSLDVEAVPKRSYSILAGEFGKLTGYPVGGNTDRPAAVGGR